MKLQTLQEAKYHNAGSFDSLMKNYFSKYGVDQEMESTFEHMWVPKQDTFPWYTEIDIRGSEHSVDEQISYIAQDLHNRDSIWVEYELDTGDNGDWMNKDHAMKHIVIRGETGTKLYP